ncbi:hypothetical protein [Caballeronia sp. KNU42]
MNIAEKSLHYLVEKWLAPTSARGIHVIQFGRTGFANSRYVRVEASTPSGSHAIFFFRHDDGSWSVFPPASSRPSMTNYRLAA